MGRDGYYWSIDECRWLPCPPPVSPQPTSPDQAVAAESESS